MKAKILKKFVELVTDSGVGELELDFGDTSLRIKKRFSIQGQGTEYTHSHHAGASVDGLLSSGSDDDELVKVKSTRVGIFYSTSVSDAVENVIVGERIQEGQPVCMIHVMGIENVVKSPVSGILEAIYLTDAQPVEYGQPLFAVRPEEVL
ncbi:MAG: hypothetical protein CVV64_03220 [Candidatus Wallbacteria bacterium HGW-Wallbacteria-1]|uniref:Lipoyl-binding domain-containing protein n=1 Tax=Candidatus Wallbacteria bacterium HGW-Wallbacteria-1 TaxID=2013854 RepID=A0A2N1PTL6_9BACT|nr:MAG: hypothetical protein CVV64_03220 [Candidatus Wallbacteria bacterium HGW-Wallbacteria-1]